FSYFLNTTMKINDVEVFSSQERGAVEVRDACLTINKTQILSKTNLTVPIGKIYCLIGPSGCGKTSLMKCIIGQLQISSGSINVFGFAPHHPKSGVPGSTIGY